MKKVIIYADGASRGNGAKDAIGAYGAIITCGGKKKEISKAFKGVTNNQMELSGVIEALKLLKSPCQVQLYSDSKYVCDAFNKNWIEGWKKKGWKTASKKPVANKELWEELINLINIHQVTFNWVKGHANNKGNQRADELCNLAMDNYNEETNKCEWDETGDIIQDVADRKCMNDISHLKNIKTKTFTLRYDFMKSVEDILENTKRDDLDKVKEELIDTIDFMFRLEE